MTARVHQVHFEKYFRSISNRFPFAIYYRIEDDLIKVYEWSIAAEPLIGSRNS